MRTVRLLLWLWMTSALLGCESRPRAPVLTDDPVFQSAREGIRFLAPEGWTQSMRGEPPSGTFDKERTLVLYRSTTGSDASLRVSLIDLPPSTDLNAYLSGPSYSAKEWVPVASPEEASVGEIPGTRYRYRARLGKREMLKEVVTVRRGDRVYLFTALHEPKDTKVRDELRRVVASVSWRK